MRPALDADPAVASPRMAWNVVIAGGGFGGLYAARRLERRLPRHSARITLVTDANFLLYTPLLPGAAAGSLEPRHVVVPLREELDWTDIRLARVTGADPTLNQLHVETLDGREETLRYDQLIVALGSVPRVLDVPGLAEHAVGFKNLAEAIALRNRAILHLEIAESLDDPEERREWLTFVFVGGGYAGVEGMAELQDYVADLLERYPRCRLDGTRWVLVEAEDRIMQEIPLSLAEAAMRELRGRGIEIRTGTRLERMDERSATLTTGETVPARTVVWTTGVKPAPVVRELGLPLTAAGRIEVDATMRVTGRENVWAIGDAAAVPDPAKRRRAAEPAHGAARPPPGQGGGGQRGGRAQRRQAAAVPLPHARVFVDMGQHKAVATMLGVRLRGFPAWFAARTYHLLAMPGGPAPPADGRLDRGPVLRPGVGRIGSTRAPPLARHFSEDPRPRGAGHGVTGAAVPSEQLQFREGRPGTCARPSPSSSGPWPRRTGPRHRPPGARPARPRSRSVAALTGPRGVHGGPGGVLLDLRGGRRIVGYAHVVRFDGMEELTEIMVEPSHHGRGIGGGCSSAAGPSRPRRSWAGSWWPRARSVDLSLYTEFGTMPSPGTGTCASPRRHTSSGAPSRPTRRGGSARAHRRRSRGGVEAPRTARDRPRPAHAARVLRA